MILQQGQEQKLLILVLCFSGNFLGTLARTVSLTDPQMVVDPNQILHNLINDEFWQNSMEAPDRDNRVYNSQSKSKLQLTPEKVPWQESPENVKRWLNSHFKPNSLNFKNDFTDNEAYGQNQQLQAKRNGGGYMCHFKLCQLGASSGKRIWNPSAMD